MLLAPAMLLPLVLSLTAWAPYRSALPKLVSGRQAVAARAAAAVAADADTVDAEADAFFRSIDENGDGLISFEELSNHLGSLGYATGAIEHVVDMLDLNRDGEISPEELRESFRRYDDPALRAALGLSLSAADAVFDALDANGDGAISRSELAAYLKGNGYGDPKYRCTADAIWQMLDINADGAVSRSELRSGYLTYSALRTALGMGNR